MFAHRAVTIRVALATFLLAAAAPLPSASAAPQVQISGASEQILQSLLTVADQTESSPSARADAISGTFLGTPYAANTLVGSAEVDEQLVVDLAGVDCFTYADYVEAAKRSHTQDEFMTSLTGVRYKDAVVAFESRKHFFTDWAVAAPAVATDVTAELSDDAISTAKTLNRKDSGGLYLPGLPVVARTVTHIPSERVDADVVGRLRTGDYVGAYATDGGLDVTHVGIFVSTPDGPVLRNASSLSAQRRVVDTPLGDYLQTVPGIVVLRPVV